MTSVKLPSFFRFFGLIVLVVGLITAAVLIRQQVLKQSAASDPTVGFQAQVIKKWTFDLDNNTEGWVGTGVTLSTSGGRLFAKLGDADQRYMSQGSVNTLLPNGEKSMATINLNYKRGSATGTYSYKIDLKYMLSGSTTWQTIAGEVISTNNEAGFKTLYYTFPSATAGKTLGRLRVAFSTSKPGDVIAIESIELLSLLATPTPYPSPSACSNCLACATLYGPVNTCLVTDAETGTVSNGRCNSDRRVTSCNGNNYCCKEGYWSTDISYCGTPTPPPTP